MNLPATPVRLDYACVGAHTRRVAAASYRRALHLRIPGDCTRRTGAQGLLVVSGNNNTTDVAVFVDVNRPLNPTNGVASRASSSLHLAYRDANPVQSTPYDDRAVERALKH